MTDPTSPLLAVVEHVLSDDDPVDLHTVVQAMDNIIAKPDDFTREEMLAVISVAAPIVSRFVMLRGALVDEVMRLELDEAQPEGNA